jgi:hypothetical protein
MSTTDGVVGVLLSAVLTVVVLSGPAAAAALATRGLWRHRPSLAPAYGLLGVGAAGLVVFFGWILAPGLGRLLAWTVVLGGALAAVALAVRLRHGDDVRGLLRSGAPVAAATVGLLVGTVGVFLLWGGSEGLYHLARVRFSHPLPIDNELPAMLAGRLLSGEDPRTPVGDWLSSDRPPLQAGLLVLVQAVSGWSGLPTATVAFTAGVVLQFAWAAPAYALCRVLTLGRRAGVTAVLFTGVSGSVLVNTVFTWPKLLSAGFLLAALALAGDLRSHVGRAPLVLSATAGLAVLALLSHGAALFALPVLAVLLWPVRRRFGLRGWLAAGGLAFATYLPWLLYQRIYDPPGDRLLKWHLAGVVEPNTHSFLSDLRSAYAELPWSTIVTYKLQNLTFPFSVPPWGAIAVEGVPTGLRASQFFTISGAVGLAVVPLVLLVGASIRHRGAAPTAAGAAGSVLVAALGSTVLWSLAMFGPGTTYLHQGSHVPVLLACVLPVAWLAGRGNRLCRVAAVALVAGQVAMAARLYLPTGTSGPLDTGALSALAVGVVLCTLGVVSARGDAQRPDDEGTQARRPKDAGGGAPGDPAAKARFTAIPQLPLAGARPQN